MMKLQRIYSQILQPLRKNETHTRVSISPDELDIFTIAILITGLVLRSLKHSLGLGKKFTALKPKTNDSSFREDGGQQLFELPDDTIMMPLKWNRQTVIQRYSRAIDPQSTTPVDFISSKAHLCLCLSAVTEPALLLLLAKRGCPVQPLGSVNVRNRFELARPDLCGSLFGSGPVSSSAIASLFIFARFGGPARHVKRGLEVDIEVDLMAEIPANGQATNRVICLFRQKFTMLQFMKFDHHPVTTRSENGKSPALGQQTGTTKQILPLNCKISSHDPYAWAEICRDYNPIHFSSVLAKMLGQQGQLAHGNHAVGLCLREMTKFAISDCSSEDTILRGTTTIEAVDRMKRFVECYHGQDAWWMEVRFRRPVVVPTTLKIVIHEDGKNFDIVNHKNEKVNIEVSFGLE